MDRRKTMQELIYTSAKKLAQAIHDKKVSSREVVRACLQRIEEVNPELNAVVQITAEAALKQAKTADEQLARGIVRGSLHGVPMTIKDSLDTAGVVTTGGTKGRASYIPDQDATVVARLRDAGAILLGKTNTPELTLSGETENLIYGTTNNPYDLSRTPGGSSGGAAAIIAAGGSPLDLGSDTGGSIRGPAHFCGITGIKPTSGRVPRTGHIVAYDLGALDSKTQIGPLARFVEDLALVLPIISGVDWRDPAVIPIPMSNPEEVDLGSLRIAYYTDNTIMTPTAETISAVKSAAQSVADAVASVKEELPPGLKRAFTLNRDISNADGRAWVRRLLDKAGTDEIHRWIKAEIESAEEIGTDAFTALLEEWDRLRSAMLFFMRDYDAILCPVNASPALAHGVSRREERRPAGSYTNVYNLTGWPGAVVRAGTSPEGLPIGVQIVARPWREDVALAIAQQIETALGGWQPPHL
jgi:amidase